jgi:3-polyprenyl-4-hydroxybenzoate decarboxylase
LHATLFLLKSITLDESNPAIKPIHMSLMEDAMPLDLSGIDLALRSGSSGNLTTVIKPCEAKTVEAVGGGIEPNKLNKRSKV